MADAAVDVIAAPDVPDIPSGAPVPASCVPAVAGCGLVAVPGGTFVMGDPDAANAIPLQTRITVGPFWLDRYEVTVARFRAFWLRTTAGSRAPTVATMYPGGLMPFEGTVDTDTELGPSDGGTSPSDLCNWHATSPARDNHPMNCVTWTTAQAFCVWDGGRLPTEAEWEFAARGTDGRVFPWGPAAMSTWMCSSRLTPRGGTCAEDDETFALVASPFGAHHMVGNVWEWIADWYAGYDEVMWWGNSARMNPIIMNRASRSRVMRGGSWNDVNAPYLRSGARYNFTPTYRSNFMGFRCARTR